MGSRAIVTQNAPCNDGQILLFDLNSATWICGEDADTDTTLSAEDVKNIIAQNVVNLAAGSTMDGAPLISTASEVATFQVRDLQGFSAQGNEVRIPTGHQLNVEDKLKIPVWTTTSRPENPATGLVGFESTTKALEIYDGTQWFPLSRQRDGKTAATAAISPTILQTQYPNLASGAYYYQVPGTNDVVRLYTDFEHDGGGWVIVSKWGGHGKSLDVIYNANERNVSALEGAGFPGFDEYARLSRDHMNRIWQQSRYVVRIHFKNSDSTSVSGVYFQKKLTSPTTFDLWHGHYTPMVWADGVEANSHQVGGGGTTYSVSFAAALTDPSLANYSSSSHFNPQTDSITGGAGHNANMGWWDQITVEAPNYGTLESARHMGFFGDITEGNQWIFTGNPSESRWNSNENRQSVVYLRW